jgi:hypothetical protein
MHRVIGTAADDTGRVRFVFENSSELRSAAADFMAGGVVNARQFSFTVLKLKRGLPRCRQLGE